jgi:hypothetical protein
MPSKDDVKEPLTEFIKRISTGQGSDTEVRTLPKILKIYFERYGYTKTSRLEQTMQMQEESRASAGHQVLQMSFPLEGLVTGEQAAAFLGYGDLKNPSSKVRRLALEGEISGPVRDGRNGYRYRAEDIRDYAARLAAEDGRKGAA